MNFLIRVPINMCKVMIFIDYYLPGHKGGGSTRSVANLVSHLGHYFSFVIVCRDRDLGDINSYKNIERDRKSDKNNSEIYYLHPNRYNWRHLRSLLNLESANILYLNSYFSYNFSIKPLLLRKFRLVPNIPVILAPRGEFSQGAISIKSLKKRIFMRFSKIIGLHKNVIWHASTPHEENDIIREMGSNAIIRIAPDLPERYRGVPQNLRRDKNKDEVKILFLSRISKKKNLHQAIEILRGVKCKVSFDIYGPIEDELYWGECQSIMETLPANVSVKYCGNVEYENVLKVFSGYHLFLFPTLGENYGHVIIESLLAGCPVLISDRTPWNGIAKYGAGWDFPLHETNSYITEIEKIAKLMQAEFDAISEMSYEFGIKQLANTKSIKMNRDLFDEVIS